MNNACDVCLLLRLDAGGGRKRGMEINLKTAKSIKRTERVHNRFAFQTHTPRAEDGTRFECEAMRLFILRRFRVQCKQVAAAYFMAVLSLAPLLPIASRDC